MTTTTFTPKNSKISVQIAKSRTDMGEAAAVQGADWIRQAIAERGEAYIVVATAPSQFDMFASLVKQPEIHWNRVTAFHLDEYIGLPIEHPASFRRNLWERFVCHLPLPLRAFHYINAEEDPAAECNRLAKLIDECTIDIAFLGIGENGHLAFNDPPADFNTTAPYLVVQLDEACRRQQWNEGWFPSLDAVPTQAITMSINRIMSSRAVVCTVPDQRKAEAVKNALTGEISPRVPASILQRHERTIVFLDEPAASCLPFK